jgi:glycosyltransferase involved in cell wall biosynthesis
MKIVITTGSLYNRNGGPYFSVRSLAKAFLLNGHEVILIGSKDASNLPDMPEGYVNLTNEFSKLTVISMDKIGPYNLHFTPGLYKQLKKIEAIDILFIQGVWMWNCWITFLFGYLNSIKSVVSVRGEFNDKKSLSELKKILLMPWIRFMLNKVTYVHVLNSLERLSLINKNINNNIREIPNGVFLNEMLVSKPQDKIVLYLGRLHPLKNVSNLIEAWCKLKANGWKLVIAGIGAEEFENELKNKAFGVDTISFFGHADEAQKDDLLRKASWFILPSLTEGMPVAALEAMSYNVPCILTEACNLNDFIESGAALECGLSSDEITIALEMALKLPDIDLESLKFKMNTILNNKYSWKQIAEDMINFTKG